MKKRSLKKGLSGFLALVMLLSVFALFPGTAQASPETENSAAYVGDGQETPSDSADPQTAGNTEAGENPEEVTDSGTADPGNVQQGTSGGAGTDETGTADGTETAGGTGTDVTETADGAEPAETENAADPTGTEEGGASVEDQGTDENAGTVQAVLEDTDNGAIPDITPGKDPSMPEAEAEQAEEETFEEDYGIMALAAGSPQYVSIGGSTYLDSEYGFALSKTCDSVTKSSYCDEYWQCPAGQEAVHGGSYYGDVIYPGENYKKGNLWIQWNGVGSYKGTKINLKCTLVGWDAIPSGSGASTTVSFSKDYVGYVQCGKMLNPKFRFEFLNADTGKAIAVKGHGTLFDVDAAQGVKLSTNCVAAYYRGSNNWFSVTDEWLWGSDGQTTNDEQKAWCTFTFSGSSFELYYSVNKYWDYSFINGNTDKDPTIGGGHALFGFIPEAINPFENPEITKSVTKTSVYSDTEFTYNLYTSIPAEQEQWRYTSLVIQDHIPDELAITGYKIYDASYNSDYTSKFTITTSGNVFRATAKNPKDAYLYGRELRVQINVTPDQSDKGWKNLTLSDYGRRVQNQGTITTSRGTSTSGTVYTTVHAQVNVQVVNGTYTKSSNSSSFRQDSVSGGYTYFTVPAGDDVKFVSRPDEGYMLKTVRINDKEIDISSEDRQGEYTYTFANIMGKANRIYVEYEPCYAISGRTWEDTDRDGQQGSNEHALNGITVQLLIRNANGTYTEVKDSSGSPVQAETRDGKKEQKHTVTISGKKYTVTASALTDGGYRFTGLPSGVYGVRFTSGSTNLVKYEASPVDQGNDASDSDAKATYQGGTLQKTEITKLDTGSMTAVADGFHMSSHNDSGFYLKRGSITIRKTGDDGKSLQGAEFRLERKQSGNWTTVESSNNRTDGNGELVYGDLEVGTYRITETRTLAGNTLLEKPIEVTIPFEKAAAGDMDSAEASYTENGKNYYLDVTYTIQNGQVFDTPSSGGAGTAGYFLAGGILAAGAGFWMLKGKQGALRPIKKGKRRKNRHEK